MLPEKLAVARRLVRFHKKAEPKLERAFLMTSRRDDLEEEPIKLLEIVEDAVESGIMPVFFQPDEPRGIPYSSIVVELSPREYVSLGQGLHVPGEDWEVGPELNLN